jgi:hypothetical protein
MDNRLLDRTTRFYAECYGKRVEILFTDDELHPHEMMTSIGVVYTADLKNIFAIVDGGDVIFAKSETERQADEIAADSKWLGELTDLQYGQADLERLLGRPTIVTADRIYVSGRSSITGDDDLRDLLDTQEDALGRGLQ